MPDDALEKAVAAVLECAKRADEDLTKLARNLANLEERFDELLDELEVLHLKVFEARHPAARPPRSPA